MRSLVDRALTALARLALRGFYRRVEVTGTVDGFRDRPALVVANHFNALLDAVLVMHVVGHLPRFVATVALWERRWARPLLWLGGLVPVHRPEDGTGDRSNQSMFRSCAEQLARGGTVALFPEGRLAPTPALRPVRSGAARIALAARAAGAEGLVVLPIGLTYEDKVALRSRALVRVGTPIAVDEVVAATAGTPHSQVVRKLTATIAQQLGAVAPVYEDELEGAVLGRAAQIALRRPDHPPTAEIPLAERDALARRLAEAPADGRDVMVAALERYELRRELAGLRDAEVVGRVGVRRLAIGLVLALLRLALVTPFALLGAGANLLPYWMVHWAGRFVDPPALRASARLLAGVLLFPAMWLFLAWIAPWNQWWARVAVVLAAPALGLVAVRALERAIELLRAWRGWITRIERQEHLAGLAVLRQEVVDRVRALDPEDPPGRER